MFHNNKKGRRLPSTSKPVNPKGGREKTLGEELREIAEKLGAQNLTTGEIKVLADKLGTLAKDILKNEKRKLPDISDITSTSKNHGISGPK